MGAALATTAVSHECAVDRSYVQVLNVQFVTALNPTVGSYNVAPRLQRHFAMLSLPQPSQESLLTIFGSMWRGHLQHYHFPERVLRVADAVLETVVSMHRRVDMRFPPTAVMFHYVFNLRDLANVRPLPWLLASQTQSANLVSERLGGS